uniref:Uncharacterized protein n=1 Tax=Oryza glumipatula TaxID=40148 RepID=A0A0E0AXW2_9ORYZ
MESGAHKSRGAAAAGGGGGGEGASGGGGGNHMVCHLCGYQYPNAHPSAKQRRAHRKNCGNPSSPSPTAAAAHAAVEEGDGKRLLLLRDDGEEAAAGGGGGDVGDGASAVAADSGGVLPGSAREVGNVADDDGNAERSSSHPHVSEVQVGLSKCTEDCVVSGDHIPPSGNDSKASGTENDEIQSGVVTRLTENVPHLEDGHHSESAVSSDQCMGSTSCLVPEHGDGARLSSEFSADEINKSSVMSLETVTGLSKDGIGNNEDDLSCVERPKAVEEDRLVNDSNVVSKEQIPCKETVSSLEQSEVMFTIGNNEDDLSCVERSKAVEEDRLVNDSNVVSREQIPCKETVSAMEQSEVMFTNSVDHVSNSTKEPVNLLEDKVSCIEKHVCLDETSSNDLFQLASGGSYSEASGIDKPRHQADCASLTPDQLVIPKEMDIDGLHCTDADVGIKALSSAVGHADEDITAVNLSKNVCSPHLTVGDDIQDSVRQTIDITPMPPQVDLAEVSTSSTSHEIDKVSRKDGIDERNPNVNLTSHEVNEVHGIDVEEIPHIEDIAAYNDYQEPNTVRATCDFEEDMQNEEIIAEASSHNITAVQSTCNVEEKEQIEKFDRNSGCNKINEISSRGVEETKLTDVNVETADEINVASSLENVEEKQSNRETIADPSVEIDVANLPSSLELSKLDVETSTYHTAYEANAVNAMENVEEMKQKEEIAVAPTSHINTISSTTNDDQKQSEELSVGPSSDEITVPHGEFSVKEKTEETVSDPTSNKTDMVSTSGGVEEQNHGDEVTSGTNTHEESVILVHTTDNVEKKMNKDLTSEPADNVEEEVQSEDIATDPTSHESSTLHITDGAESKKQDAKVAADPAAGKIDVPRSADDAEEQKHEATVSTDDDLKGDDPSESNSPQIIDGAGDKEQDAETAADPPPGKTDAPPSTDDAEETKPKEEELETVGTVVDDPKEEDKEEIADKEVIVNSDKNHVSLKSLLSEKAAETKESKKPSTKDRVLSFRRRVSKDGGSPAKPGSPKAAVSGQQQDWNSPARLPVEKKPKGKKQQWVPFICCPSMS